MTTHNQPTPTTDYRTAARQRNAALKAELVQLQRQQDAYALRAQFTPTDSLEEEAAYWADWRKANPDALRPRARLTVADKLVAGAGLALILVVIAWITLLWSFGW